MSFLGPPFKHDLFTSYAHGRAGDLKHWSQCLVERLKGNILDLKVEFADLKVFIDTDLDPTRPLTEQLRGEVQASGLLLVIMSDHYLESAWCKDEREWFESEINACKDGGGSVLVVRAHPTDHASWPDCFKDERGHAVLGFRFHPNGQNLDDIVYPYGWPEPLPSDRPYYQELSRLSTVVIRRLREIRERRALEAAADEPSVQMSIQGKPRIYLQALPGEWSRWQLTREIMESAGCEVLPDVLPSSRAHIAAQQEMRRQRIKTLDQHAHALCLLGSSKSIDLDREIEIIASDRFALQALGKSVPCALLHRGNERLNTDELARLGIDAIDASGDDWLLRFQGWLQGALAPETVS